MTNGKETPVKDPIEAARKEVVKEATAWITENPDANVLLVFRPIVTAIDPKTGEFFIEVKGDLVEKVPNGIVDSKVYKSIYATLGVKERKILTPEEAIAEMQHRQ